jgi:hypothetical protein
MTWENINVSTSRLHLIYQRAGMDQRYDIQSLKLQGGRVADSRMATTLAAN